jgi:hypothetical protein
MWFGALCHVSYACPIESVSRASGGFLLALLCCEETGVCVETAGRNSSSIDYAEGATATPSCARQGKNKYPRLCPPCHIPLPTHLQLAS